MADARRVRRLRSQSLIHDRRSQAKINLSYQGTIWHSKANQRARNAEGKPERTGKSMTRASPMTMAKRQLGKSDNRGKMVARSATLVAENVYSKFDHKYHLVEALGDHYTDNEQRQHQKKNRPSTSLSLKEQGNIMQTGCPPYS